MCVFPRNMHTIYVGIACEQVMAMADPSLSKQDRANCCRRAQRAQAVAMMYPPAVAVLVPLKLVTSLELPNKSLILPGASVE